MKEGHHWWTPFKFTTGSYISSRVVILTKFRITSCVRMNKTIFPACERPFPRIKCSLRSGNAILQKWLAWERRCRAFPTQFNPGRAIARRRRSEGPFLLSRDWGYSVQEGSPDYRCRIVARIAIVILRHNQQKF